ncbi:ubiquitin-like protein 4A [Ostrinia furnacalis]|uniref:ubiquitin-like protein 4A n=1 Tax=Ostrinia furnacalis TaxID=93504 RepID=UPI001040AA0B|nr:ubiquitin-like protein 4A [Ostrinia furnacalis]
MKITIKKLQGGECTLEVLPTTCISEIKRQISEKLKIPVEEQKLLLLGRTLTDEQTVQSYPTIKDGSKLNLVVKKPDGLYEASIKYFKKLGMSDAEAVNKAHRLLKVVQDKFNKLSWDDIDRLSMDCLLDERGCRPMVQRDLDNNDMFSL